MAEGDIFGTRALGGKALDAQGIAVSAAKADQTSPAVAHGMDRFLVVWTDQRNGSLDIFGARLTP